MSSIEQSWERIHIWLRSNASKILESLQGAADKSEINQLEEIIESKLPQQLIEFYSFHNGINPNVLANLFYGINFISISNTIKQISNYETPNDKKPLKYADCEINYSYTFGRKRLPIASDNGTCLLCVDLDPIDNGLVGQIIFLDYDYSVAFKLANSIEELLEKFSDDLESEKYSLLPEALEEGNEWLSPIKEIDPCNWFNSPTWSHIKI